MAAKINIQTGSPPPPPYVQHALFPPENIIVIALGYSAQSQIPFIID